MMKGSRGMGGAKASEGEGAHHGQGEPDEAEGPQG
jgi:hypothetical protein